MTITASLLVDMIKIAISDKERDADQLDGWANESERGGWSTHQVDPMRKQADALRREASAMRQKLNAAHAQAKEQSS